MVLQFVLASASPARRQLLVSAGIQPYVCPSHFDEDQVQATEPTALVHALAAGKARTVAPQFANALVLGCDSVLAFEGEIYGKPATPEAAIARWRSMRGRVGHLHTGHALIDTHGQQTLTRCEVTEVFFANLSDAQIDAYVASGEPLRCAGAFAIDGRGSWFVDKIVGCHTNVIGLSMPLLRQMIQDLGYTITDFWSKG